jgi:hypothetical protein
MLSISKYGRYWFVNVLKLQRYPHVSHLLMVIWSSNLFIGSQFSHQIINKRDTTDVFVILMHLETIVTTSHLFKD